METIKFLFSSWHSGICFTICFYFFMLNLSLTINRILRHWNIRKHGYPPIHCDADGDANTVESYEEEI